MKINLNIERKARIEMLPLIDIVFLLLVFFIYAMLSMAVHRGLPVILPTSSSARIEKELMISVTVKRDGTIYVDKHLIALKDLEKLLKRKAKGASEPGVLLFADRSLSELGKSIGIRFLVAVVLRDNKFIIPSGTTVLRAGDILYVVSTEENFEHLYERIGKQKLECVPFSRWMMNRSSDPKSSLNSARFLRRCAVNAGSFLSCSRPIAPDISVGRTL